mmetsp:Transcript_313/g.747  ORF Transcript_313/g.747 Transcript_313/m.747 type:complete len:126 (-) Transcript_313:645-1022(-)
MQIEFGSMGYKNRFPLSFTLGKGIQKDRRTLAFGACVFRLNNSLSSLYATISSTVCIRIFAAHPVSFPLQLSFSPFCPDFSLVFMKQGLKRRNEARCASKGKGGFSTLMCGGLHASPLLCLIMHC